MLRSRGRFVAEPDEVPDFWITYADLLVALLMAFALLLFLALSRFQETADIIGRHKIVMDNVLARSAAALDESGVRVSFDSSTGNMRLDSDVLFEFGSARLRDQGRLTVRLIAERYLPSLLSDSLLRREIEMISVVGHTDTVGSWLSNLELSQRRARAVLEELVESSTPASAAELMPRISATGRSETEPVLTSDGTVDAERSRRIEIRVRLRSDQYVKMLLATLRDTSATAAGVRP